MELDLIQTRKLSRSWLNSLICRLKTVKTLIVHGSKERPQTGLRCWCAGDHELNEVKAEKHPLVASPLEFATEGDPRSREIRAGSLGPVNLRRCQWSLTVLLAMIVISVPVPNIDGKHYFRLSTGSVMLPCRKWRISVMWSPVTRPDGKVL